MPVRPKAELISDVDRQRAAQAPDPIRTPTLKVAFDKLVAVLGLVVLAAVLVLIALAIKVDGWLYPGGILVKRGGL